MSCPCITIVTILVLCVTNVNTLLKPLDSKELGPCDYNTTQANPIGPSEHDTTQANPSNWRNKKFVTKRKPAVNHDMLLERYRVSNVIVEGIARVDENENLTKIVEDIGHKLGFNSSYTAKVVADVHRAKLKYQNKPEPIIIRLINPATRVKWVNAFRGRKLWRENWTLNEHLTKSKQDLFIKTSDWGKRHGYKFAWVQECKVFLRKNETSKILIVHNLAHLKRILRKDKLIEKARKNQTILNSRTNPKLNQSSTASEKNPLRKHKLRENAHKN
uniref:FP protein C-terminal domain-containing protein n=1 Tax=Cacopsylla melanoneura TaxID=428564 RepID=A0A8D8M5R7_9HEMI